MLLSALLRDAKIEYSGADLEIEGITSDSRKAKANTLFVCICGFASDGHAYALNAYNNGCRVFVVEKAVELPPDATVIMQKNTRISLALISAAFYSFPARKLKVVGITGTKGKTTTALMCESVANKNGISAGYIGSNGVSFAGKHFETANTTPESIELHRLFSEMVKDGVEVVFLEVSSQALYLERVCGIDFFATAFTNLAPDHIGGVEHPTFEHYRDSKKKLFCDYVSKYAIFNSEDAASEYMMNGAKAAVTCFGKGGDCFAFCSASNALISYLGFETQIVRRDIALAATRGNHFWVLVNCGTEENPQWYHHDSCPRRKPYQQYTYMLTDAQLKAMTKYIAANGGKNDYFTFDTSLHPASATEIMVNLGIDSKYYD